MSPGREAIRAALRAHRWYTTGSAAYTPGVFGCQGCELAEFSTLDAYEAHVADAVLAGLALVTQEGK